MVPGMSALLIGVLLVGLLIVAIASSWIRRRRAATVIIAAEPETALLSSAAALRRLGARITRYDTEGGTLEARAATAGVVRVRAIARDGTTTRLDVQGDARGVIRRFRDALAAGPRA